MNFTNFPFSRRCRARLKLLRRSPRSSCLLYCFRFGLILLLILLVTIYIVSIDRITEKSDESLDFIDVDNSYNDGEPLPQFNFLVAINPIMPKYEGLVLLPPQAITTQLPLLVSDENPERITNFINRRYSELMNYGPPVKSNSSRDQGTFDQILTIPKLYNNLESSYSLWRPRELHVNGNDIIDKDDRILAQLLLTMEDFSRTNIGKFEKKMILLTSPLSWWNRRSTDEFLEGCPQLRDKCEFVVDTRYKSGTISAVISSGITLLRPSYAQADNIFVFYFVLESNYVANVVLKRQTDILTSFWRGSGLITPYGKWAYFDPLVQQKEQEKNYAEGKTKLVAAFVTNCAPVNTRQQYITLLGQHIQVDVYGYCGPLNCPRSDEEECFRKLKKEYKFYLAFENANCRDYITEKFWDNALRNDVVPVVMGAHPDDYEAVAPKGSYIHIEEFKTTRDLAAYLTYLDEHDEEYNKYFKWKGTGTFVDGKYFCRVCAMLHYAQLNPPPPRTQAFSFHREGLRKNCLPYQQTYWTSSSWKLQ